MPATEGAGGGDAVRVSPSLVADMDILDWARGLARTRGGALAAERCLREPISDVAVLRERGRRSLRAALDRKARRAREVLRGAEDDALWWFARDVRATLPLFPILFPQWFALRWMNRAPPLIAGYHMYRSYLTPLMVMLAPLTTILGPYWYIRRTLKWQLSLAKYLGFLKNGLVLYLRPAPGALPEHTAFKYAALGIYIAITVYGILQTLDIAKVFREVREALLAKTESARRVLAEFGRAARGALPSGIAGAYALATDSRVRERLAEALRLGYSQDLAIVGGDLLTAPGPRRWKKSTAWCLPTYADPCGAGGVGAGASRFWAMRHPTLADGGRPNPADLSRSVLITGPNAAGKTTYMKALAANTLLAQTFGIVCASRAEVVPVDMLGAFVRVGDSIGVASLFQAEVARCRELCADAAAVSAAGGRAVLFLDEPMHSTPPTEGAATAVSVAKYLIGLPGVRVVVTSHFAVMAEIAEELPALMANVCVRADLRAAGGDGADAADAGPPYSFTYRVQPGASFQSIALEMLEAEALPAEVVAGAVQMVNKICGKGVSN